MTAYCLALKYRRFWVTYWREKPYLSFMQNTELYRWCGPKLISLHNFKRLFEMPKLKRNHSSGFGDKLKHANGSALQIYRWSWQTERPAGVLEYVSILISKGPVMTVSILLLSCFTRGGCKHSVGFAPQDGITLQHCDSARRDIGTLKEDLAPTSSATLEVNRWQMSGCLSTSSVGLAMPKHKTHTWQ